MSLTANPRLRFLYAVWAVVECVGFGGLIQGWSSLVYVLKDEGVYADLCNPANESLEIGGTANASIRYGINNTNFTNDLNPEEQKCSAQDAKLNLVYTIGSAVVSLGSFIIGQINFKYGTRISRLVATTIYIPGALMLAFTSKETPWLVFPGLALVGFGGIAFLMTNTQVASLFPTGGSLFVGILCGGFDASASIQLLIKLGYENGITRKNSYLIIAGTHLLTLVSTFVFLPKDYIHKVDSDSKTKNTDNGVIEKETETKINVKNIQEKAEGTVTDEKEKDKSDTPSVQILKKYMLTPTYLLHIMWLSFLQLRFIFVVGSINKRLESMLDTKAEVSHYTNVMLYMMTAGVITSPFAGYVYGYQFKIFKGSKSDLRRQLMPSVIPLAVTTTLSVLMSALMFVENAMVFYGAFLVMVFFRSFLYTMGAGYISAIYPSSYFGILYGSKIIIGGTVSLLQYALFAWADANGFTQVNIFLLVLTLVTYTHPAYQWWDCRRAERQAVMSSTCKEINDHMKVPDVNENNSDKTGKINEAFTPELERSRPI